MYSSPSAFHKYCIGPFLKTNGSLNGANIWVSVSVKYGTELWARKPNRKRSTGLSFKSMKRAYTYGKLETLLHLDEVKRAFRRNITKIDRQFANMMDKIADAESNTAVTAYGRRIDRLEKDKLIKEEKLQNGTAPQRHFDEMFELALQFLSNPWKLWDSDRLEDKRTVLKLAFGERLAYCRYEGLRTPQLSEPFMFLENFDKKRKWRRVK